MKKLTTILFAPILITFLFVPYLQAKEPERKKEVVEQTQREGMVQKQNPIGKEPELIWQRDFGSEIRRFKLRKTVDAREFPILAVETKDALIVFDKEGNEKIKRQIPRLEFEQKGKKEVSRGFTAISDNGEYVLEGKGIPEFSYNLKYTTVDGKTLWEKKDFYGQPIVSPDGSTIVLLNTKGGKNEKRSVEFYSESGKLLKQHFIDLSSIEMPLYALAFSEDGNYFVLRVEQWIEDKKGRRAIYPVILFDKKGNLLWQKNIEVTPGKTSIFELLISPHGSIISYSSDKYIYSVNKDGRLLWKKEFHNLRSFSDNEDLMSLAKGKTSIIVKSLSGNKIWSMEEGYPIISPDGSLLAILGSIYEASEEKLTVHLARMSDKKLKLILSTRNIHPSERKFKFSADSKYIYLTMVKEKTKILVFKINLTKFGLS